MGISGSFSFDSSFEQKSWRGWPAGYVVGRVTPVIGSINWAAQTSY